MFMTVDLLRKTSEAVVPERNDNLSIFDFKAAEKAMVMPQSFTAVKTGLSMSIPSDDDVCIIFPRCKLSSRGITLLNSFDMITREHADDDILIYLMNMSNTIFTVEPGDKIAKFAFIKLVDTRFNVHNVPLMDKVINHD